MIEPLVVPHLWPIEVQRWEPTTVASEVPGWCFRRAGWRRDRSWSHPRLIRLRARA